MKKSTHIGFKLKSPLFDLPYFSLPYSFPPDVMHAQAINILKLLLSIILDPSCEGNQKNKTGEKIEIREFLFNEEQMNAYFEFLGLLDEHTPQAFRDNIFKPEKKTATLTYWLKSAAQGEALLKSLYLLPEFIPSLTEKQEHLLYLYSQMAALMMINNSSYINEDLNLDLVQESWEIVIQNFELLVTLGYNKNGFIGTLPLHTMLHTPGYLKKVGSLKTFSSYATERMVKSIKESQQNSRYPIITLCNYQLKFYVINLIFIGQATPEILQPAMKLSSQNGECTTDEELELLELLKKSLVKNYPKYRNNKNTASSKSPTSYGMNLLFEKNTGKFVDNTLNSDMYYYQRYSKIHWNTSKYTAIASNSKLRNTKELNTFVRVIQSKNSSGAKSPSYYANLLDCFSVGKGTGEAWDRFAIIEKIPDESLRSIDLHDDFKHICFSNEIKLGFYWENEYKHGERIVVPLNRIANPVFIIPQYNFLLSMQCCRRLVQLIMHVMGRTSAYINLTSSEKLTPLNYHVWATKILLGLRAMNNGVHLYVEAGTVNPAANESLEDLTASLDTVVHDVILNNISPELIEHVNDVAIRGRDLWLYLHQEYSQLQPADVISLMKSLYAGNIDVGPKFVSSVRSYVATWRSIYQSLSPDSVVAFNALASMGPNCERFIQYALEHRFDSNNNTDNLDINNFIRNTDKWAKLLKITGPPATLSTEAFVASSKKYNNKSKGDGIKCFRCKRRGHTSNNCHVSWEEVQAARQDNKDDKESKEAKTSRGWFAETIDEFSEIVDDDPFVSSAFVSETSVVSEKFGNSCSESFDDLESELFDSSEPCVGDEDCFVGQVSEYCSNSGLDIDSVGSTDDSCFNSEPYVGSTVVCLESEPCVSSAPICFFDSESLVDSDIVPFDSEPLVGSSFISCSDSKPLVGSDDDIVLPSFDFLVDSITEPSPPNVKPIVTPKSRFSPFFYLSFVTIMLFSLILIVVWHPSSILDLSHSVHHVFVAESTTSAEANLVVGSDSFDFIHDTGATSHICNNISYFSSLRPTSATIRGLGSATAEGLATLSLIFLIPRNLFAARRATAGGCRFIQDLNHISAVENGKTRVHAIAMGDLYFCRFRVVLPSKPVHEVFAVESSANLWHKRLGHASVDVLKKLSKSLSVKPTHFEVVDSHKCDACLGGKATALPFNGTTEKASRPLELFVSDLSGPHVATPVGHRYVLTIMDYYSRYSYVELLVRKSDASLAIRNFIARCESYFSGDSAGDRVAYFHSDNGGEYISKDLEQFFVSKGIKHTYTVPHTPQQNGVAERLNRTLFEKAKSMLLYAHAPEYLWGEAVKSANYIRNRLPSRTTGGVAPLQLWTGKPPSYHHMKVFGCQATVVLPGAKRESKLTYRVLLDSSIVEARSVYFDESKFPFMKSDKDLSINGTGVGFSVGSSIGSGSGSMSGPCFDSKGTGLGSNVRVNSIASSDSSSGSSFGSHRSLPASSSGSGSGSICALPSPSSSPSHSPSLSSSSSSIIVHKPRSVRRILSTPSAPLESPTLPSIPSVPSLPSSPILPPSDHDVSISPDSSPIVSPSEYIPSQLDLSEAGPSINESDISGDSGISQRGVILGFNRLSLLQSPSPDLVNSLDQAGVSVVTKDDTQAVLPKSRSRVVAVRLPSITPAKRPSSDDIVSPPSKHLCENSLKQSPVSATPAKRPAEEECISYRHPSSFEEAMSSEEAEFWLEACVIEMSSLKRNGTWELVDLPPGRKAINSKWVFKVKRKADGSIERYKARLVCIGFSQVEGIDYTETFAPVVRYETVRIVLAIAAQFGFQVHHMDVETAFLNGDLKEDIYMRQPKGFVVKGQESKVCHLKKSLYGLKQAPLCWNEKIHGALVKLGFIRNESDYGVYTKGSGSTMVIIALYVDDLLISGNSSEVIAKTKSSLSSMFKMKDLGPVEQFLGMRVKQSPYHITVDVSRYIFDMLEEFGMQNCSSVKTPLPTRDLSDFSESDSATDASMYRSIIGKLIYAANCARPDLAVAVSFLCRYMQSPKSIHMEAAKHTLRYLKGTAELGLEYRAQKVYKLVGYSDADYAQDKQDRKSFTGYVFILSGGPITWACRKQVSPASSSVESEYMSLSDASKECFWINQLLSLCKIPVPLPVTMFEDNQGCIALAQNPVFHRRTKHIDVRYHVVRHYIRSGVIHLEYLDTQVMLADMFTKNLGRVKFETLRGLLGMKAVGDSATRGGVEHAMLSQTSAVDNAREFGWETMVDNLCLF
ncbi:uncharacterized protein SAPINGB_P000535 [Magnusiomyces paraingens]|uniref:Uncharacterized protein n=1 Tax=Magnusiomyces paraingens TaxID=2606893 RepID=A0A5E8B7H8_9ASCO|nr:uncharacterized protein SAPINGB_P000535 [Saprochaete ingens]VVT44791.1 unnamed protein product [Saprochaete ingens]